MIKKMLVSMLIFTLIPIAVLVWILVFRALADNPSNIQELFTKNEPTKFVFQEEEPVSNSLTSENNMNTTEVTKKEEPVKEVVTGKGSLKGTITWQYNDFVGTKGDVDAKIVLISETFDSSRYSDDDLSLLTFGITVGMEGVYAVNADGYGHYEMSNIPAGNYVLLVLSNKTRRNMKEPIDSYTQQTLRKVLNIGNFNEFGFLNLKKHTVEEIMIKENETTNFSHDFGYTYI
ncbi:hypothetical protein [Bacillus solimangrovi]|uniref:SD-repeat containing protein B domain-containing protein n=1 Tax=Bacillus solimangrovi TaxID=1305675 RepID=A0A1E5LFU4_9BACI|nr:hypothetical protein [Bacillus solimangrovi]OEH92957.1 hypothetical protein BFG57_14390 [Bacillus solimangrovi]